MPPPSAVPLVHPARRPLVVRFGALGDTILLTALIESLARTWGEPCDVVALGGAPHAIFAGLESVGEIVTLGSRKRPFLASPDQRRLVAWLRQRSPSPAYVVEELPKVDWLLARGGVRPEHRVDLRTVPRGDLENTVDHLHRMAKYLPPAFDDGRPATTGAAPRIRLAESELADCRSWLAARGWAEAPYVVVQTQSRRRKRGRWPAEKWAALLRRVRAAAPESRVLLAGAEHELPEIEAIRARVADPWVVAAAHDLPLRRLFALLVRAQSCISLDTGPAQAAGVLGCPVVVLFGRAEPRRNRPWGPDEKVRIVTSLPPDAWWPTRALWETNHQLEAIAVDDVFASWQELATR
jgi:ADP-heptose:LPS heptosyltransferase